LLVEAENPKKRLVLTNEAHHKKLAVAGYLLIANPEVLIADFKVHFMSLGLPQKTVPKVAHENKCLFIVH
jgi:hypothetical protein